MKEASTLQWRRSLPCLALIAAMILLLLIGCSSSGPEEEEAELWAHWKLAQTQGTTADDASGNGRDGVISGAKWSTDGFAHLSFPEEGGRVEVDGLEDLPEAYTIAAWVQLREAPASRYLVLSGRGGSCGWAFYTNWEGQRLALVLSGDTRRVGFLSDVLVPADGAWHHAAVTRTGKTIAFFIDGTPAGDDETSLEACADIISLAIGGLAADDPRGDSFVGGLRDLRLYERALSASEIESLVEETRPGAE